MKLKELLTALGKKVNFDLTKPEFADILSSDIDIPDVMATAIEKGLMTEDAALNNSGIRSRLRAEVFNGFDREFENTLADFELEEDSRTSILGEKKTIDRMKKLSTVLKEKADKAAKDGNKADAAALRQQVTDLNNQIRDLKANQQTQIDQLKADNENNLIGFELKSILGTRKYALPEQMELSEQINMSHGFVSQDLANAGLKLVRENGKLRLLKQDGTEPYDDKNTPIQLNNFVDSSLSKRGLLKVSDPATGQPGNDAPPAVPGKQQLHSAYQDAMAQTDSMLAALQDQN
ncbi:hypothetical protein QTN47_17060 [Danxiaibacter flavus]|uniref:Uncharacterized protein n=1 Tax=Danxiaibacter flavus TaxID=3049108 RepID=A0ABV3ZH44_9BACT|nr:hypothetical protein QNM32_17070 [Chitinophagaceae bacterium DXS]